MRCLYFCLRDQLKRNYNLGQYWLDVEIEDVSSFDEALAEKLSKIPSEHLPLVYILIAFLNNFKYRCLMNPP